jgi:hypothetical protein
MAQEKYPKGKHPSSLKNLEGHQFKKGQSGNPRGHPTNRLSLTAIARKELGKPCPLAKGKTWGQYLVGQWLRNAAKNATYFTELLERMDGKVIQPIGGNPDMPMIVEIHKIVAHVTEDKNGSSSSAGS